MARTWGQGRKLPKSSPIGSQNKFLQEDPTAPDGVKFVGVVGTVTDAADVPFDASGLDNTSATDVQTALEDFDAAITAATDEAVAASGVTFVPAGLDNTAATDVQNALEDFDAAITAASGGGGGGGPTDWVTLAPIGNYAGSVNLVESLNINTNTRFDFSQATNAQIVGDNIVLANDGLDVQPGLYQIDLILKFGTSTASGSGLLSYGCLESIDVGDGSGLGYISSPTSTSPNDATPVAVSFVINVPTADTIAFNYRYENAGSSGYVQLEGGTIVRLGDALA